MPEKTEPAVVRPSNPLSDAIRSFANSLNALRDFVNLVGSILDEHQKKSLRKHRKALLTVLLGINAVLKKPQLSEAEAANIKKQLGGEVKLEVIGQNSVNIQLDHAEPKKNYIDAIKVITVASKHQSLLYRSALISLISSAEWFLSQVFREHLERYPETAGTKDKLLSLDELKSFDSVGDARKYIIDIRIDEIMWGSLEDWIKYLTEKIKLSAGYLKPTKERLTEIFQRRNVMVHNNGVANSIYFHKVAAEFRPGISLGQELTISPEYLRDGIDLIESNFILLGAELWKQLDAKDEDRGAAIANVAFERLSEERWTVAETLSNFLRADKQLPERFQLIGLLNYWQSLKWGGRFDEVKSDIESADFSAKDELFQIGRYALLDDVENFVKLLPIVLGADKLDEEKLVTWPIFKEMVKTERVSEFLKLRKQDTKSTQHEEAGISKPEDSEPAGENARKQKSAISD
ncbi:MAG TPA: hypothetical protein VFF39_04720 [Verrucomicrobiae bacterium]|nr:hypothetical protein [Verrucomicrobiae bacterium]